jgi:hypothetical protein
LLMGVSAFTEAALVDYVLRGVEAPPWLSEGVNVPVSEMSGASRILGRYGDLSIRPRPIKSAASHH